MKDKNKFILCLGENYFEANVHANPRRENSVARGDIGWSFFAGTWQLESRHQNRWADVPTNQDWPAGFFPTSSFSSGKSFSALLSQCLSVIMKTSHDWVLDYGIKWAIVGRERSVRKDGGEVKTGENPVSHQRRFWRKEVERESQRTIWQPEKVKSGESELDTMVLTLVGWVLKYTLFHILLALHKDHEISWPLPE